MHKLQIKALQGAVDALSDCLNDLESWHNDSTEGPTPQEKSDLRRMTKAYEKARDWLARAPLDGGKANG